MKTSIATILFVLINYCSFAQGDQNPPRSVRETFQKTYPQSQPTRWDHNSLGWSVIFEDRDHDNGEVTAHFDNEGRHQDTHVYYDNKDVPDPVMNNLRQRYNGSDNYEFTRIDRPQKENIYQAHFRHHNRNMTRYMDERGNERTYHDRH